MAITTIPRLAARKDRPPKRVRVRVHQPKPKPEPDAEPATGGPKHHRFDTKVIEQRPGLRVTVPDPESWETCYCEIGKNH